MIAYLALNVLCRRVPVGVNLLAVDMAGRYCNSNSNLFLYMEYLALDLRVTPLEQGKDIILAEM